MGDRAQPKKTDAELLATRGGPPCYLAIKWEKRMYDAHELRDFDQIGHTLGGSNPKYKADESELKGIAKEFGDQIGTNDPLSAGFEEMCTSGKLDVASKKLAETMSKKARREYVDILEADDAQTAYSYVPQSYFYDAQPAVVLPYTYQSGTDSTDHAVTMALALGIFMIICALCFVVHVVVAAASCFVFGQWQSSKQQHGLKYQAVDREQV